MGWTNGFIVTHHFFIRQSSPTLCGYKTKKTSRAMAEQGAQGRESGVGSEPMSILSPCATPKFLNHSLLSTAVF